MDDNEVDLRFTGEEPEPITEEEREATREVFTHLIASAQKYPPAVMVDMPGGGTVAITIGAQIVEWLEFERYLYLGE